MEYKTEWETYQETECTTEYKRDCEFHWEGSGYDKKWGEDPATCKNNPYDTCNDVTKRRSKSVPQQKCESVPKPLCVTVPNTTCRDVPDQECRNQPYQKCDKVPEQNCRREHKKTPKRISKSVPIKVCDGGSAGGYGSGAGSSGTDPGIRSSGGIEFEVDNDVEVITNTKKDSSAIKFGN